MREIKFRAWDIESKKMFEINSAMFGMFSKNRNIHCIFNHGEESIYLGDNCPVMQFTGLKDRNGKDIYESDILMGAAKEPMIIEWYFNRFIYRVKGRIQEFNKLDIEAGFFEIVGNVFENKELLDT